MNGRGAPTTFRRAELGSAPGATSSAMDVPPPTRVGPSGARPAANRHFARASGTRPYHPRYDQTRIALRVAVRATCLTRCGPVWSGARKIGPALRDQAATNTPARAPTNPSADGRFDRRPRGNALRRSRTNLIAPSGVRKDADHRTGGPRSYLTLYLPATGHVSYGGWGG
jgi:hypothetical protein